MKIFPLLFVLYLSSINVQINNAEIDCTIYDNDLDIININPFYVSLYLSLFSTSVKYDETLHVTEFNIFNDANPSSSIYCLKNLQRLQLSNTNLTILPDIKNFQKLTSLSIDIDNGTIDQHLPSELGQLISLSNLKLSNIKNLQDLPNEIKYLIQLQSLTLQNMPNFNKIPDESIGKLTNLNTLELSGLPYLSNIPSTMNNFQLLRQLEITRTNVDNLQLENLVSLYDLKITYNLILQTIQITNMLKLYSIDIEYNNELLTLILQNLSSLLTLTISSNTELVSLDIENLSSLQTISITNSAQLKNITLKKFSRLDSLQLNSLSNLELISFENAPLLSTITITSSPRLKTISFFDLPSIKNLDLSGCQLTTFPESILKLKSLTKLVMTSNQLSALPLTLSTDLPYLQVLNLVNNKFQENIFQPPLVYIRELYLSNNSLTSIDGIGNYKSLQQLELNFNKISSIPLEIMKLSSTLTGITINYNLLNRIPYPMANMRSLKTFFATNNNIPNNERQYLYSLFNKSPIKATF
ncbi:unnamed protein product [Rotaria sordida]|uniref:L domain-like protein n=1 Tax=Rotaria sordida TaxID=392033 RepID=A0A813V187_9BILA|nr:unnamed protein product [Rotaria sordida]CAF3944312.1 unnamed protein product [Rotaria sordida]